MRHKKYVHVPQHDEQMRKAGAPLVYLSALRLDTDYFKFHPFGPGYQVHTSDGKSLGIRDMDGKIFHVPYNATGYAQPDVVPTLPKRAFVYEQDKIEFGSKSTSIPERHRKRIVKEDENMPKAMRDVMSRKHDRTEDLSAEEEAAIESKYSSLSVKHNNLMAIDIHTTHDKNGNPRRLALILNTRGFIDASGTYAYTSPSEVYVKHFGSMPREKNWFRIDVTPRTYRELVKECKAKGGFYHAG